MCRITHGVCGYGSSMSSRRPPPPDPVVPRKEGRGWKTYALAGAVVLLAILILQNLQEVEVRFLFIDATIPLIFALLIVGALGALIGWAAPRVRRGGYEAPQRD